MLIEELYKGYVIAKSNYVNKPCMETEVLMLDALEAYLKEANRRLCNMRKDSSIKAEQALIRKYFKG